MTIHFYLNNEEETPIMSYYDMASNPFKVGDTISISVDELYPADYAKYSASLQSKMKTDSEKLEETFRLKKIRLVKEGKHARINLIHESKLTIEYHCVFTKD